MYMPVPIRQLFEVPRAILDDALAKLLAIETSEGYAFKLQAWQRIDSYAFERAPDLSRYVGQALVDYVMQQFPDQLLFGWSLSMLPAQEKVIEHTDRLFFHRLAKRIIVPLGHAEDVLNWSYASDKQTKLYYMLPEGHGYQLNTAVTHGLSNNGRYDRRAVYFDVIERRLHQRFSSHPDLTKVILQQNTGAIHVL